jgi:hypothetical protein
MKPENESGGPVSKATAHMITTSPKEVDVLGELVNGVTIVHGDLRLWLREALHLLELCRAEPEKGFRYLALWFVRLGRAMA